MKETKGITDDDPDAVEAIQARIDASAVFSQTGIVLSIEKV